MIFDENDNVFAGWVVLDQVNWLSRDPACSKQLYKLSGLIDIQYIVV